MKNLPYTASELVTLTEHFNLTEQEWKTIKEIRVLMTMNLEQLLKVEMTGIRVE